MASSVPRELALSALAAYEARHTLGSMDAAATSAHTDSLPALSRRELEILAMTSRGLSNRQIAAELHLTVHAVKFHLSSIFRKLGVANRTEAAVLFANAAHGIDPAASSVG